MLYKFTLFNSTVNLLKLSIIIRECLAHTILLLKLTDVNIFLLGNSRIINFEAVAADLITDKC